MTGASQVASPVPRIKVLVVDSAATGRLLLADLLNVARDLQVVAFAADESQVLSAIRDKNPDVMLCSIGPQMLNGLDIVSRVLRTSPLPVLLIADERERASALTLRALALGAFAFVAKPATDNSARAATESICEQLRRAYLRRNTTPAGVKASLPTAALVPCSKIILIGASTGGTEAVREVLQAFPSEMPPILVVQHMPELFTASFAKRLDGASRIRVKEAEDGETLQPSVAYVAPGHSHLSVRSVPGGFACALSDAPPVNRHRPSVDVLFLSAAKVLGAKALGVLLTGMGKDGAQGLLALRQAGAWTIAQDEKSSVVWGMPREAVLIGGAQEVVSLKDIPAHVLQRLRVAERSLV